jgi:HK97 family phage portal protein
MSILTRVRAAFKSLVVGYDTTSVWYGRYSTGFYGGDIDYTTEAGDLGLNSIVVACINFIADNFPGAPVIVTAPKGDDREPVKGHLLTQLLENPNPYYSGALLWKPTLYSYHVAGNAYWQKIRSNIGAVVALYYLPHTIVRCVSLEGEFISYYEIWDGTRWNAIPREDIVHFRNGLKVNDRRYGSGDLDSALREVFTDNEAARFSANILRNMGIPGGIISSADSDNPITDAPAIKAAFMNATTGDRRGEVIVVTTPLKYDPPTTNPKDINVDEFRRKAEERIPALLGIHPAVVGLGAGLDRSTYSNMEEAFRAAWRNNLIPTQTVLAAELTTQLLPDLGRPNERVEFDYSDVEALQESRNDQVTRAVAAYNAGLVKRSEARQWLGLQSDPDDEQYKSSPAPVLPAPMEREVEPIALPEPVKALGMLLNGNGHR